MIPHPADIRYVSFKALKQAYSSKSASIIDVRTPEAFGGGHIPGAANHCVYEVAFTEAVQKAFPEKGAWIIVYGESSSYKAAEVAYGRLVESGYKHVEVFLGGVSTWLAEGCQVEISGKTVPSSLFHGRLSVDPEKSHLLWFGRNLKNQHNGKLAIKSGWIQMDDGKPLGGEVVVDMESLTCDDVGDKETNKSLVAHLKNADFFKVDAYPESSFVLKSCEPIYENTIGQPNLRVAGEMTVRGVTRPMNFRAMLNPIEEGVSFQAQFDLNRVIFGAVYGSGSLFEQLGMHLVNDLVNIQITAVFAD